MVKRIISQILMLSLYGIAFYSWLVMGYEQVGQAILIYFWLITSLLIFAFVVLLFTGGREPDPNKTWLSRVIGAAGMFGVFGAFVWAGHPVLGTLYLAFGFATSVMEKKISN